MYPISSVYSYKLEKYPMKQFLRKSGLLFSVMLLFACATMAQQKKVYLLEIKDNIDPRSNRYIDLALKAAEQKEVDLVIIELDTYGGAVTDADDIRTRIMDFSIPIYVFINKDAASAGALISIASDSIYMAPGASIGAATVVTADGAAAPDKYQSYMRSIMRSTAEAKGRNPYIAEAMVSQDIEIEGITKKGEVITFSTSEAIKHGFCEAEVRSINDILERSGFENAQLIKHELSSAEKIISIFLNPFVSGILILIIIGGLYFELQTPGVGFPIAASLIALMLYLTPYYLVGLADNWEIALLIVGIILIGVEVFVLPGFGIAGIAGIVLMVLSLSLMMVANDFFDFTFVSSAELSSAVLSVVAGILGGFILIIVGGVQLSKTNLFKRIALTEVQDKNDGYSATVRAASMVGKEGIVFSVLRPSGKVEVEGEIYDAFTRGEYLEKGTKIVVIEDGTMSLKVKALA
jgi:membrane-bound serine protease (ClpP class)